MKYVITTVDEFMRDVKRGWVKFQDNDNSSYGTSDKHKMWAMENVRNEIGRVIEMLNRMNRGEHSEAIGFVDTDDCWLISDYGVSERMKMFYDVFKNDFEEGDAVHDVCYVWEDNTDGGFAGTYFFEMCAGKDITFNAINCRNLFRTTDFLDATKDFSEENKKKCQNLVATLKNYPICYAIKNKI